MPSRPVLKRENTVGPWTSRSLKIARALCSLSQADTSSLTAIQNFRNTSFSFIASERHCDVERREWRFTKVLRATLRAHAAGAGVMSALNNARNQDAAVMQTDTLNGSGRLEAVI